MIILAFFVFLVIFCFCACTLAKDADDKLEKIESGEPAVLIDNKEDRKMKFTEEEVLMLRDAMKIYGNAVVDNELKFSSPDELHAATFEIWTSINQRLFKKLESMLLEMMNNRNDE